MDKPDLLFRIIGRYDHYIEIANNKANYLLAFVISVSAAISALFGYSDILKFGPNQIIITTLKASTILAYTINILSALAILRGIHRVIFPNTSSPTTPVKSRIFFGDVASLSHIDYANHVKTMSTQDIQEDLSHQANALAKIVEDKFKHQKRIMEIASQQYIWSALTVSILCALIKAHS